MIDEFYILKPLGSGTYATAYLASHTKTHEVLVLKDFSKETLMQTDLINRV